MILGVGIDMVDVDRVRRSMARWGDRWTGRIFTEAERKYCEAARDPAPRYAARFAAKEAFYKALPIQPKAFIPGRIEVLESGGKPSVRGLDSYEEYITAMQPIKLHVSITHEKNMAAAVVVVERESPRNRPVVSR